MIEFESMNKALKASWVKRLINDTDSPWKIIPNCTTQQYGGLKFLLACNYSTKELKLNSVPPFYREVLKICEEIKRKKLEVYQDSIDPHDIIIWNNSDIKVEAKPVFYKSWHDAGVEKVKDLLDPSNGNFYTYQEFTTKFKVKGSFITYYGLLNAIRSKWKVLAPPIPSETRNQNWFDDVENLTTSALHKIIVENKFQPSINENKIISLGVARPDMHKIYNWPFKTTKDTKLIMFQFKINHDIIYTKDKLKKANLISDDTCHLCKKEKHTIKHMFLQCVHVVSFWNKFKAWWHYNTKEIINLNDLTLLYGLVKPQKHQKALSLVLLVAKYFIYKSNLVEESLLFSLFKLQLKETLMTERYIVIKNKTAKFFNNKWNCLISSNFIRAIPVGVTY